MRDDEQPVVGAMSHGDPPTEPLVQIDIVEGTDPVGGRPLRPSDTLVADAPQRPAAAETEFVHRVGAPGIADVEGLIARLPESAAEPSTRRTPGQQRRRRLAFVGVVVALVVVIAASIRELWGLEKEEGTGDAVGREGAPVEVPPVETSSSSPPPAPSRETTVLEDLPGRGESAEPFLARTVEHVTPEGHRAEVTLKRGPIAEGHVTVVNLWATWCVPCQLELPGLKKLFEDNRAVWGDDVRFVPVMVDSRDPLSAHAEYADRMPETEFFLSDGGAVLEVLRKMLKSHKKGKKLPELPITLVFDCRRDLRLPHVGMLLQPDFDKLREQLGELHGELRSRFCTASKSKPSPPPPAEEKAAIKPRCGDGRCQAPEETATNCCDCVKCPRSDKCEQQPKAVPRCVNTLESLK